MNIIKDLKLIIKQFILNIKFIIKDKTIISSFIFFGIISQIISIIFIPFWLSGAIKMLFTQTIPLLLLLGGLSYNWKKSTLNKNQTITSSNKLTIYSSLIITLFVVGNIAALFSFALDLGLGEAGIQLNGWVWESKGNATMYLENVNWVVFFYSINLNILVTFSIYFVIHRMVSNIKNYFVIVLCFLILGVIFGGSINNYFYGLSTQKPSSTDLDYGVYGGQGALFPDSFFPISLIYPFYSISQFYQISIFIPLSGNALSWIPFKDLGHIWPFLVSFSKPYWQWSLVIIFPYIHILFNFIVGTIASFIKNK